jgi:hypothetical protein
MPRATLRPLRLPDDVLQVPPSLPISRTEFYREELIKHQQCLQALRESFSPRAIAEVEQAIHNTLAQLDRLCDNCDCNHIDQVVSCLLRKLDQVTNLSAWSDPKTLN